MSASIAGPEAADPVVAAEHMSGIDGRRCQRLFGCELHLRAREREDERQAVAERAPGVEVRRQGDERTGIDERACRRHRPAEEERARRQKDAGDVARRQLRDTLRPRRLEMVDRPCSQLDRKGNGARLGELVAVEPQREARVAACLEVAPRLARRRTSRARERRRRPRRGRPRPRGRPRAGSRCRHRRRRTRAARCALRARSGRRRPRGRREAGRAPCRDRGRSPTCPRTSSCRGRASTPGGGA